jgi:cytochrome c556
MNKPKVVGIAIVLAFALSVLALRFHSTHAPEVAASANTASSQHALDVTTVSSGSNQASKMTGNDLRQVMEVRVHQDYTMMSFTIWHDRPLTNDKMDAIAAASSRIAQEAQGLEAFEDAYRQQGWSTRDVKFFDENRLRLFRVAEELNRAAQNHDEAQVISFFMHLDNTCQSCHKKFRPDLSWT